MFMMHFNKYKCSTRGNALFLILIAVALFAALSYAITQSGRGGGSIDNEQSMIDASNMVQYAGQLRQAVTRLKVIGGCSDTQLNFASARWGTPASYVNAAAPSDGSCDIFGANGGGVSWQAPPASTGATEYAVNGGITIYGVGTSVSDTDEGSKDLALYAWVRNKATCVQINNRMGIANPGGDPPTVSAANGISAIPATTYAFRGIFDNDNALGVASRAAEISGFPTGCVYCTRASDCPSQKYQFYHVLVER
jgi:hypothetical protein